MSYKELLEKYPEHDDLWTFLGSGSREELDLRVSGVPHGIILTEGHPANPSITYTLKVSSNETSISLVPRLLVVRYEGIPNRATDIASKLTYFNEKGLHDVEAFGTLKWESNHPYLDAGALYHNRRLV